MDALVDAACAPAHRPDLDDPGPLLSSSRIRLREQSEELAPISVRRRGRPIRRAHPVGKHGQTPRKTRWRGDPGGRRAGHRIRTRNPFRDRDRGIPQASTGAWELRPNGGGTEMTYTFRSTWDLPTLVLGGAFRRASA